MPISPSYLALAGCVVVGGYLLAGGDEAPVAQPHAPAARTAELPAPLLARPAAAVEPVLAEPAVEIEDEPIRGLAAIEDRAELAFVFSLDGDSYLELSSDARALVRGTARLVEEDDVHAVIAPVATDAMPADLRAWAGRSVLVDGECLARVVGFAEVSRIAGEAADPYAEEGEDHPEPAAWTIESITETGVVLAAKLDGCSGTWARSTDYAPAAVVAAIEAPALAEAAKQELLARRDADPTQDEWRDAGGEGDWRDAAEVITQVYQHPLTDERWVFVQARRHGSCGDPGFQVMAAYRASSDGTVRRVADLSFGHDTLAGAVDLDGDGQPELLLGEGNRTELVDLANEHHGSIGVEYRSYGCGC